MISRVITVIAAAAPKPAKPTTGVDLSGLPQPAADSTTLHNILTTVFGIFAAVALLVIVISSLRYVFSAGDPNTAARMKNTIIYASVGLIVSMLAYAMVSFVLTNI